MISSLYFISFLIFLTRETDYTCKETGETLECCTSVTGCLTCDENQKQCLTCSNGNVVGNECVPSTRTGTETDTKCTAGSNDGDCQTCNDENTACTKCVGTKYIINGITCKACDGDLVANEQHTQCITSGTGSDTKCTTGSNDGDCQTCNDENTACTKCVGTKYIINGITCKACDGDLVANEQHTQCITSGTGSDTKCTTGSNDGDCQTCNDENTACTKCVGTKYIINGITCKACDGDLVANEQHTQCITSGTGSDTKCTTGSNDGDCQTCNNDNSACTKCVGTKYIINGITCKACDGDLVANEQHTQCITSGTGSDTKCTTGSNDGDCQTCNDENTACTKCVGTKYIINGITCKACDGDLVANEQHTQCITSGTGSDTKCTAGSNDGDCQTCNNDNSACTKCVGTKYIINGITCKACDGDLVANEQHTQCITSGTGSDTKCTTGSNDGDCQTCNNDNSACTKCVGTKYIINGITCKACEGELVANEQHTQCVSSETGNKCIVGSANDDCKICNEGKTECIKCFGTNYILDGLKCKACAGDLIANEQQTECIKDPGSGPISPEGCDNNVPVGCIRCNESDHSQCIACDTKKLFNEKVNSNGICECANSTDIISDEGQCVPEYTSCDQSQIDRGCKTCFLYDKKVCAICDEKNGFKPKPENNFCLCANDEYNNTNGNCSEILVTCQWGTTTPISGCTLCHNRRPNECAECDSAKGLYYNSSTKNCKCKVEGYIPNKQGYCDKPSNSYCNETEMIGCIQCEQNNKVKCLICDESKGFILDDENPDKCKCKINGYEPNTEGLCSKPIKTYCLANVSIPGCIKCSEEKPQECSACDSNLNFDLDATESKCKCIDGYTLRIDGRCSNYIPEDAKAPDSLLTPDRLSENYAITEDSSLIINTTNMANSDLKLYTATVDDKCNVINVIDNDFENVQIKISSREKPLNVTIGNNQKIKLDTSGVDIPLNLPKNSEQIALKASESSTLTIDSVDNDKQVNIGNVSVSSNSILTIKPQQPITLDIVNFFDNSQINVESNQNTKVSAKTINVQQGSEPTIQNIKISNVLNMAPDSKLTIGQQVDISTSTFRIFKSFSQQYDDTYFHFNQKIEQSPKSIEVLEASENTILDDLDDKIILIHQSESTFGSDMCKKWKDAVDNNKGECILNDPAFSNDNDKQNSVYAYKTTGKQDGPEKNKLSAGAIAGIVIACVVVVAAIIALLVYFLVIKKKNQSTTSTNDESSIQI